MTLYIIHALLDLQTFEIKFIVYHCLSMPMGIDNMIWFRHRSESIAAHDEPLIFCLLSASKTGV